MNNDDFIVLKTRKKSYLTSPNRKIVKQSFLVLPNGKIYLSLFVGVDVVTALGWGLNDEVIISYHRDNNKILKIEKAKLEDSNTHLLTNPLKNDNFSNLKIQARWHLYSEISKDERKIKTIKHTIQDNYLIIDISGDNS